TNHLDIWACDSLEEAVKSFDGTVLVVSHDRYFLNRVADLLIVIEPGKSEVVFGNFDTYELLRASRAAAEKANALHSKEKPAPAEKQDTAAKPGAKRKRKYPYKKAAEVEAMIATAEARIAELEELLQSPDTYRDATKLKDTMTEVERLKGSLPGMYEHWEEAIELNG
ncbi:MAG: ABC-F family ATP-binding cassette domain-containing protein, partial [Gemmataceae bacterium]